ncbi:fatty acyl-CoA reductase 1-like isoform X2 [Argiope bruennichi]|uniref:fatty acyl-CoA reductase 1-like isoform X2 n=1 Tax=Argiope bruennichi TaxID=94029 RepID=UPI0024948476|nr:fatty acyl-CoA reductase 1-like isoform X2 [Argiope bruennichi]
MFGLTAENKYLPKVADFYQNKSIFVTGTTGFVGSVLLEILLRCCPGIKTIYILLRSKKNVEPTARKEEIFSKKIFEKLKEENEEVLNKVHVMTGDINLPNLGLSEDDRRLLIEEVSIVMHCAANVQFNRPLRFMLENIVLGLNSVIELCRKIKKFEALVFTSTAYSNCNRIGVTLKEEIYRLPFRAEKFIEALNNDNEKLEELVAQCKPPWPNAYTFSKCLAENLIMDTATDLPVAIVRPSIIINICKSPLPGYEEGNTGLERLCIGVGKGFVKVVHADPNCKLNLVPVDIVGNTHILAACCVGLKRCSTPLIINVTATDNFHIKLSEYVETLVEVALKRPVPQSFSKLTTCILEPSRYMYSMIAIYHHYIPAIVLDGMLKLFGGKPKLYSLYRFFDNIMASYDFFVFNDFEFERNNLERLDKLIHPEDRKDLSLDFKDETLRDIAKKTPEVCPFYDLKIDKRSPSERQKIIQWRYMMVTSIQGIFVLSCGLIIYFLFALIF